MFADTSTANHNPYAAGSAMPLPKPDHRAKKHGKPTKPSAYRKWRHEAVSDDYAAGEVVAVADAVFAEGC